MIKQFKPFHGCLSIVQILAPGREFASVKYFSALRTMKNNIRFEYVP